MFKIRVKTLWEVEIYIYFNIPWMFKEVSYLIKSDTVKSSFLVFLSLILLTHGFLSLDKAGFKIRQVCSFFLSEAKRVMKLHFWHQKQETTILLYFSFFFFFLNKSSIKIFRYSFHVLCVFYILLVSNFWNIMWNLLSLHHSSL